MDILRRMFSKAHDEKSAQESKFQRNEFRKPAWYEEDETDDELFGQTTKAFQMFTNPIEMQKHFEHQMKEIIKSMREAEGSNDFFERDFREEYLKPGFENSTNEDFKNHISDTDLDGVVDVNEIHSLVQRVTPELEKILSDHELPSNHNPIIDIKKLTDTEKILGKIHGTILDEEEKRPRIKQKRDPALPRFKPNLGGVFEGAYQGPKMFGQSVITHTMLKPDGTYETKRVVKDSEGNVKTTITRTKEGKSETITTYNDGHNEQNVNSTIKQNNSILASDRNIFVSKKGYALPMNLW